MLQCASRLMIRSIRMVKTQTASLCIVMVIFNGFGRFLKHFPAVFT